MTEIRSLPESVTTESSGTSDTNGRWFESSDGLWYEITQAQRMPEFLMSLSSASDHWMFVSSRGALSAGRRDADRALFPYYSADKITDTRHQTGPRTIIRTRRDDDQTGIWQPFWSDTVADESIERRIRRNSVGNQLILEENHHGLGLSFSYRWTFSHRYGFVRTSRLVAMTDQPGTLEVLDGLQNILPYGIDQYFQLRFSNLVDAYKKNELVESAGVGLFYLSSIPTDRAEPSEGLRATAVWSTADPQHILLSNRQIPNFLAGKDISTERDVRGARGAYLLHQVVELNQGDEKQWDIVADVNLDQTDVLDLINEIREPQICQHLAEDIEQCETRLLAAIAQSDGIQIGNNFALNQRHLSNVKFNIMRGGVPLQDYTIDVADFVQHLRTMNIDAHDRNQEWLTSLPAEIDRDVLLTQAKSTGDRDLQRIAMEYIPLVFSRRHGDPTRPWNAFAIDSHLSAAERTFSYEGNWRDLFQNWEALAVSYPSYLNSMIWRFVNASTADGYNPYRVMKSGFEWEVPEPEDHWSNIGYWCDHQIIYLQRLLQMSRHCFPGELDLELDSELFAYADVPYRIRPMKAIFENPQDTVVYDDAHAQQIQRRVESIGRDGQLLHNRDNRLSRATLGEKLLLPALVKMSNFVPDGGIWLNTQRPEWNDANNALVGNGLSVVTTCHLRRYFAFLLEWFQNSATRSFRISGEIVKLLEQIQLAISPYVIGKPNRISSTQRFQIVVDLSRAGSDYREGIYKNGLSEQKTEFTTQQCCEFFQGCLQILDATIESNQRGDGLYHSYNLMSRDVDGEIHIERLYEMLEGQVAVLNSGMLNPEQAVGVLEALRTSRMYRPDQDSYLLYPDRELPRFLDKNNIPAELVNQSALLKRLIEDGDTSVVRRDVAGSFHFNGDFRNAADVRRAVAELAKTRDYGALIESGTRQLESIFENIFCHHQFTGRSGTFFAYEGLGSIYWHMVSKLALATIENFVEARRSEAPSSVLEQLASHFRQIRTGIGAEKSPIEYGAFPGDPYSHTPSQSGVQQPGMTGQVKEDILSRFLEIGVRVEAGRISFDPVLLQPSEFTNRLATLPKGLSGFSELIGDQNNDAARFLFTLCGVPVVYSTTGCFQVEVLYADGRNETADELLLSAEQSRELFSRSGNIRQINVNLDPGDYPRYQSS